MVRRHKERYVKGCETRWNVTGLRLDPATSSRFRSGGATKKSALMVSRSSSRVVMSLCLALEAACSGARPPDVAATKTTCL